jgi:hypothetical protein
MPGSLPATRILVGSSQYISKKRAGAGFNGIEKGQFIIGWSLLKASTT